MQWMGKLIGILSTSLIFISGCAEMSGPPDVSTPTYQEYVEFDSIVDVPVKTAYANVLQKAPFCWRTDYSGEIEAQAPSSPQDPAQIRFLVPGKLVGSKVPLTAVRLYPLADNRTRIIGLSTILPGQWHLSSLAAWAQAVTTECSAVQADYPV